MAFLKIVFVLACILGFSHCAFVDTINKCEVANKECHRNLIQKFIKDIGKTGIPELEMPPFDPVELKNLNASILNVIDMVLVDGTAKGISNCVIDNTDLDIDHLRCSLQLTCDITVNGKYTLKSSSSIIKDLLGADIHGEGNGKVKLEKITVKVEFPFEVKKRGDDTFLSSDIKKYKYTFSVHKVIFAADKLYLGDKESSTEIVKLLNDNWKAIVDTFGGHFLDIAMKNIYDSLQKFFDTIPTKNYFIDDISSYA